jgi:hypothetical protein
MAMLDKHEPVKTKKAKLPIEHLAGQRTLPSTQEELKHHLERKAKRKGDRLLSAAEAALQREAHATQSEEAQKVHHT